MMEGYLLCSLLPLKFHIVIGMEIRAKNKSMMIEPTLTMTPYLPPLNHIRGKKR